MQKKTISFFFLGLFTTLVIATSAILYLVDWNQYRDELSQVVSERLGVRVEVAGDLSLQLLPRPSLSARAIRLSPLLTEYNDTIATVDRIDMRLGLSAALTGNIELQSLSLDGVSVAMEETVNGWRVKGWPEAPETGEGSQNTEGETSLVSLDRFQLENSTVIAKRLNGSTITFDQIDLDLSGTLPTGPVDWDGSVVVAETPLSVSGRIVPVKSRDETSIRSEIKVADTTIEASGRITPSGDMTGRLKAEGESVKKLAVFIAKLTNTEAPASVPAIPFALDTQIDKESGITRVVSRQFSIDETRGVVDVTVAEKNDGYHLTGTTTLGVITLNDDVFSNSGSDNQSRPSSTVDTTTADNEALPITGAIDITVEGVEVRGGLIQQVNAVVGFESGAPFLSQFSALMPGASRIAYAASGSDLSGKVTFQSGRLPEMFTWMDISLSDAVPSGRLTTADISGNVRVTDAGWMISDVEGSVDTSRVEAAMSGSVAPFSMNSAKIDIDKLNLDAYWPEPSLPESDTQSSASFPDMEIELNIDTLQWLHRSFSGLKARVMMSDNDMELSNFAVNSEGGSLSGALKLTGAGSAGYIANEIEGEIKYTRWKYPVIKALMPENSEFLTAISDDLPITGAVSFNGPANAVQSRITMLADKNSLEMTGTFDTGTPLGFDLQGTVDHENALAVLASMPNSSMPDALLDGTLPVSLNINAAGTTDDVDFRLGGLVTGHQIDVSGQYQPARSTVEFSMNMPSGISQEMQDLTGDYAGVLDVQQPSRVRFDLDYSTDNISLTNIDISNGIMRTSGKVAVASNNVNGALALNNVNVDRILNALDRESEESSANYSGELALDVTNLTLMGQRLDAPSSKLTLSQRSINVSLGDDATLNNQPVTGDIDLADAKASTIQFTTATIDAGKLLEVAGITKSVSGMITTNVNLSTKGNTPQEMLSGLSGDVSFNGGAGSMYFMAVPKLIEALTSSGSKTAFLNIIGGLLRSGETGFTNVNGSLRFDGGVALIDEIVASGDWGKFSVGGQANIVDDIINMRGSLDLARPQDTPSIPVVYQGSLTSPTTNWASGAIERFALAGIQRRIRNELFGEFDKAQSENGDAASANPGSAVMGAAFGLLSKLREAQEAKKKEQADTNGDEKPDTE